jgi:subfamily B ATP-binding cassette protein MsbA
MSGPEKLKSQKKTIQETYSRLLLYSLRYKLIILISIIALIVMALTNAGFLSLIKKITDEGLVQKATEAFTFLPLTLFMLIFFRAIANFVSNYSLKWVSRKVVEDLRVDIFKNLMLLPNAFFDANAAGNIVSKVTYETEQLSNIVIKVALDALRDSMTVVAVFIYMLYLDWFLTLCFIIIIPIIVFYLKKVSPRLRDAGQEIQETMGDMTRVAEEGISGQRIVKIFGTAKYELQRFWLYAVRNRKMQTKLAKLAGGNSFFVEIVSGIFLTFIVHYSLNNLTAGEFAAFATALLMLLNPIRKLTQINEHIQVGYAAGLSIFSIMDEKKEGGSGRKKIRRVKGEIQFRNVSFTYSSQKAKALSSINIDIKTGEKVALVGKSGGGKSTIINLVPLFYALDSGEILIDGIDTRDYKLSNLREQIALVSQDIILFNDTIMNNIGYGKNYSLSQVKNAAKAANADEFISRLPQKYNHIIGDRGVKLSGGQKQRIAIARAILKNAPILLLDEATSALDSESEKLVQRALDNLMQKRTSIVVAHRLSTVMNADKIIVIDKGKVVEIGNHKQLLAQKGFYAKLYQKGFN